MTLHKMDGKMLVYIPPPPIYLNEKSMKLEQESVTWAYLDRTYFKNTSGKKQGRSSQW